MLLFTDLSENFKIIDKIYIQYKLTTTEIFEQERKFSFIPNNAVLIIYGKILNVNTFHIVYFVKTNKDIKNIGKIGMCRFLNILKNRFTNIDTIVLNSYPLQDNPSDYEIKKLSDYYKREYGLKIIKILDTNAIVMQGNIDEILSKCDDEIGIGYLFRKLK